MGHKQNQNATEERMASIVSISWLIASGRRGGDQVRCADTATRSAFDSLFEQPPSPSPSPPTPRPPPPTPGPLTSPCRTRRPSGPSKA